MQRLDGALENYGLPQISTLPDFRLFPASFLNRIALMTDAVLFEAAIIIAIIVLADVCAARAPDKIALLADAVLGFENVTVPVRPAYALLKLGSPKPATTDRKAA